MWRLIEKVTNPLSLLQDICSFVDFLILVLVTLAARLEADEKVMSEERAAWLAINQSLAEKKVARQIADRSARSYQEANTALNQDLQSVQAFVTATMEKLSSKSSALDLAVIWEREVQINLQKLDEEKKAQEHLFKYAQKALDKWDFSSSAVTSSAVAHVMALVKNHVPGFDTKILQRDFSIDKVEQEALIHSVCDTAQHFVSLYDFSILAESDDNKSSGAW
jgi:predicted RNA-binding protein YlxR (DUF448 family)